MKTRQPIQVAILAVLLSGASTVSVFANQSPHATGGYQHRHDNGTTISPGGTIPQGVGVDFGATVTDPDAGDTIRIEVELLPLPATFTGTPNYVSTYVSSGSVATIPTITGLSAGNYGWRYRAVDNHGLATGWVPAGNPDFIVQAVNQSPHATGGYQHRDDNGTTISPGGTIPQGVGVDFGATVTDPDAGDTIKIEVELHPLPATFTGTANYVSTFVSSGSVASIPTITGLAAGSYGWQYRAVDNHGLATGWVPAGNPDFIVQAVNQSPHATGGYQHRDDNGTTISPGGTIPQGVGVDFGATVTDPDAGDTIKIEVELHPLPATFTGTANYVSTFVSSGSVASIPTITGLAAGSYGWQYRAVDNHGLATGWVPAGNPDFIVQAVNQSPHATGGYQHRDDNGTTISPGGTIPQGVGVDFGATVTDPDAGDTIKIEVELHPLPATFTGTANYVSTFVSSGSVASIPTITGLAAGSYGWQYRAVDNHGLATGWVPAGNPDFIVQAVNQPVLSINPASPPAQSATAGSLGLAVNNTGDGTMSYSASVSSGSTWISIISGASGGNSGTINVSFSGNTGAQRTGTITVTAPGASGSPAVINITQSGSSTTRKGVDSDRAPSLNALASGGYGFVIRYVSPAGNLKNITSSEAQVFETAGIDVILVFESTGVDVLDGYNAGVADANTAVAQATAAGAPPDFFCYFACDFDAQSTDQQAINDYLDGAAHVLGASRVGFYGGYYPMKAVLDAGKAAKGWQTSSWSVGKIDPRISIYQNQNVSAGISHCDFDLGYGDDLGQWKTKIISLGGPLPFGNVAAGNSATLLLNIANKGNTPLTVNSISYPSGFAGNWPSGTIAPHSWVNVTVTFEPASAIGYGGNITVSSDATSGTPTSPISGNGVNSQPTTYTVSRLYDEIISGPSWSCIIS